MRHKSVTERAEKILLRVIDRILEEPKRVHMQNWLIGGYELESRLREREEYEKSEWSSTPTFLPWVAPKCNTVGCIAGWAVAERNAINKKGRFFTVDTVEEDAAKLLSIPADDYGYRRTDFLFIPSAWPNPYKDKLENLTPQTMPYAKVVASRIRYYIRTGK